VQCFVLLLAFVARIVVSHVFRRRLSFASYPSFRISSAVHAVLRRDFISRSLREQSFLLQVEFSVFTLASVRGTVVRQWTRGLLEPGCRAGRFLEADQVWGSSRRPVALLLEIRRCEPTVRLIVHRLWRFPTIAVSCFYQFEASFGLLESKTDGRLICSAISRRRRLLRC